MKVAYHEVIDGCIEAAKVAVRILEYAHMSEKCAQISDLYIEEALEDADRLVKKLDEVWKRQIFHTR